VQLGLCGDVLKAFVKAELLEVIGLTEFVVSQRAPAAAADHTVLLTTTKRVTIPNRSSSP